MPKPFFSRLVDYYSSVAAVLRGESDAAAIFPNPTDKGGAREQLYVDFLRAHLPSACNANLGGFVFNQFGEESKQIDVIVSADTCPRFDVGGKSFACIDGVLAVVSIKSILDSDAIRDAVTNIASVPQHRIDYPWDKIAIDNPMIDMWPLKVIYAIDGVSVETLQQTFSEFNNPEPTIPKNRLPDVLHVAGKYSLRRSWVDIIHEGRTIPACRYVTMTAEVDAACLAFVVERIQQLCLASRLIPYNYSEYLYRMFEMEPPAT
ncbi:MAG: hypothetical protein H8E44_40730 [Planctomycetes bacterium]|nr:hypothetical protein [Planctomycetota bacterium]